MKKVAMALVLLVGTLVTGCSTLVETAPERSGRIAMQNKFQMKMAVEDWDYLWLMERSSRLTQWHPTVGY